MAFLKHRHKGRPLLAQRSYGMATLLLCLALPFTELSNAPAEEKRHTEYEVKAAILYKLTKFIDWSCTEIEGEGKGDFRVGVLGEDPFGELLDKTLKNQKVGGRRIRIARAARAEDLRACRIVFVSRSEQDRFREIAKELAEYCTLTVADGEGFAEQGGMVNLLRKGDKIGFEINVDATKAAGLEVNSQLLKLARIVRTAEERTEE